MKKLYSIFILTVFFSLFNTSFAAISTPTTVSGIQAKASKPEVFKPTKADLKSMSIAEIEAKMGHKLTWKQKLAVKLLRKKGGDGSFGIGFALGFFLGILGVLIAYFAFDDEEKTRKGAWWGMGAALLLYILVLGLFWSTFFAVM
jgi:hypothetical protein